MIGGLKPTARSRRDFSLTKVFGAPSLDIPRQYDVEDEKGDINQPRVQEDMFCLAYAISELGADEHGIPMDAHFQAAFMGLLAGAPILNGADMRVGIKSGRTFGFLPTSLCPFHNQDVTREHIADWNNWPWHLVDEAGKYKMPAFFKVDGPYDAFDNHRAQLYRHKPDNGIALGIPWYESFNETGSNGIVKPGEGAYFWHAVTVKGYRYINNKEYVRVRSWSGRMFGKNSYGYFTREQFNKLLATAGSISFMYKDIPDNLILSLKERQLDLLEILLDLRSRVLIKLKHNVWI